ncbi:SDR family oxidoreductase [Amycolatopsis cynarae]|uniref:SDR family oxidoreductase n=1 Tax=Amycolatopsis cynarae TaxID=2995223 RepID=A0ABY7AVI1_9PSEU|nr:SDR family oxidoreductase [Amycolatopsis sp. HUAS 11-8]WAL63747.1 SDR family oxidoreductase [Amycolatopsis sp. HUAS 11-8]
MRVFVTGATGFVGSAVVRELAGAGHQVLGLARSDTSAASLSAAGAQVHRGALEDLDSLRAAAAGADGVIHTAFVHDFANFAAAVETDRRAIETLGEVLAGSGRPFVITSGTTGLVHGRPATEESTPEPGSPAALRFASEELALSFAARGVRVSVVRLPPSVHSEADKHGFVTQLIGVAREKGVSAFVDDGANRWAAVHQLDAAHLFRLALEHAEAGSRWHGVGDESVATRDIAEVIGRQLDLPVASVPSEEAAAHFGFLGAVFSLDTPASNALTRQRLGWEPTHPGLLADLEKDHYFTA